MKRVRKEGTKVWHNPDLTTYTRRSAAPRVAPRPSETPEDRRTTSEQRAALEALFAPKRDKGEAVADDKPEVAIPTTPKPLGRIVLPPPPSADPRVVEHKKLLAKLMRAEGRPAISKAANEFLRAGFSFPDEQDVHLQLLEHTNEDHVCTALEKLGAILVGEPPQRRAMLESRLRRIEQLADEAQTRAAAERLRRQVTGKGQTGGPSVG